MDGSENNSVENFEDEIIKEIKMSKDITKYSMELVDEYERTYKYRHMLVNSVNKHVNSMEGWKRLSNEKYEKSGFEEKKDIYVFTEDEEKKDLEISKKLVYICSNYELDKGVYIKLINALVERQNCRDTLTAERTAMISTALFGVDEFDARNKSCFPLFKKYFSIKFGNKKIITKIERFKYIPNPKTINYEQNHIFSIQDLIMALKKANADDIFVFANKFQDIMERTTETTFERYSEQLFTLVYNMQDIKQADQQAYILSNIIIRNSKYFDIMIKDFFNTKLETKQILIISTFCITDELLLDNIETKLEMHTKFTEMFISTNIDFSTIIWESIDKYLKSGMLLLTNYI